MHWALITYLLTYSKEQSPFSEINQFSVSQEIPLWNLKFHYLEENSVSISCWKIDKSWPHYHLLVDVNTCKCFDKQFKQVEFLLLTWRYVPQTQSTNNLFSFFVPCCKWKTRDSSQSRHLSIVRYKWDKCTGCGQAKTLWPLLNYFCYPVRGMSKQQSTKTVISKVICMILWLKPAVEIQRKIQALKTQFHRKTRNRWIPREVRILQRRLSGLGM